jgi:hypothetical protein
MDVSVGGWRRRWRTAARDPAAMGHAVKMAPVNCWGGTGGECLFSIHMPRLPVHVYIFFLEISF